MIEREVRPLERLINTYYLVENIVLKNNENNTTNDVQRITIPEKVDLNLTNKNVELEKIVTEILKIFKNVDYEISYQKIDNNNTAFLYLSSILSNNDIIMLANLSEQLQFHFAIISSREKIDKKNRNSKIEIYLNK